MGSRFSALALLCTSCGSEGLLALDGVADAHAIVDGSTDTLHDGVVALVTRAGSLRCSGSVIHERVVLTARHCIAGIELDRYRVAFGVDGDDDPIEIEAADVHADYDVGLLTLAASVPTTVSVHRVVDRLSDPTAVGLDVEIVGFGREDSYSGGSGTRRSGVARITIVDELEFAFDPTPSSVCFGDSGGPTFARVGAADDIIGVHSRTLDTACEMRGFDVRVAALVDSFIRPHLDLVDRPTGGDPKSCDCGASRLPSVLTFAALALCVRGRRTGRQWSKSPRRVC
jgi:hypothetical protein